MGRAPALVALGCMLAVTAAGPELCCEDMTAECLSCKDDTDLDEYCEENPHTTGCKGACCREKIKNGEPAGLNCMACFKGETKAEFCTHLLGELTSPTWWQDIDSWLSAKKDRLKKLKRKCKKYVAEKCDGAICTMDLCSDGKGRRPIGDDCCACPPKDCSTTPCTKDLCWDGQGRRQIGDDCCACPPKVVVDCSTAICTKDLCWDGLGRRQIGDDCCACPEPERREQLDITVSAGGENATAVRVRAHDNNAPVKCDMSMLSMGSVAVNVILAVVIVILAVVVCRGRQDQISAEVEMEPTGSSPSSSPTAKTQPSPVV